MGNKKKAHVTKFAHTSITTPEFLDFLYSYMTKTHGDKMKLILDGVDWNSWLKHPGMPPVINEFDRTLAKECESLSKR